MATDVVGLDAQLIRTGLPPQEVMPPQPIPRDTSLRAQKTVEAIDYELPSARQLLLELKHQLETGQVRPAATQ